MKNKSTWSRNICSLSRELIHLIEGRVIPYQVIFQWPFLPLLVPCCTCKWYCSGPGLSLASTASLWIWYNHILLEDKVPRPIHLSNIFFCCQLSQCQVILRCTTCTTCHYQYHWMNEPSIARMKSMIWHYKPKYDIATLNPQSCWKQDRWRHLWS